MPTQLLDEDLVRRLPLPLAQLYRRAHNAKTPLECHLTAFYLWEAALKLLASAAIVEYAGHAAGDAHVTERLQNLARPALGHWWEFARLLVPALAERGDAGFVKLRDLLLGRSRNDCPRAAGLDAVLREQLDGKKGTQATVRFTELFDRLVRLRNEEMGHGAAGQRPADYYAGTGPALLAGVAEVLSRLDVLAGRRLLHVADVRRLASGNWLVERYELLGESVRRLESLEAAEVDGVRLPRPGRLYLYDDTVSAESPWKALHPLVVYDAEAARVFFLNARRGERRADYLCYTTGEVSKRDELGQERRELLASILGGPVDEAAADVWAARSQAEEPAVPEPSTPVPRTMGEFELLSKLGQGGMGTVYRAWQPSLGRQVALKSLHQTGDPRAEARFAREIRALGRVEHPHLVRIFTSGSDGEHWFYAMELVEGTTLGAVCEKLHSRATDPTRVDGPVWAETVSTACLESRQAEKPLGKSEQATSGERRVTGKEKENDQPADAVPPSPVPRSPTHSYVRQVVEVVRQVAEAAHALHEAGIVHRDIKPGNIMLTPGGQKAVLTDLGLAQLSDEVAGKLTKTRQFVGTLRYTSPEQVLAVGAVDRRSDIYSLGVTLWELLTLRPMYAANEQTPTPELMQRIQYAEPEPPRRCNARVPRDLEAVVLKCLEKDPKRRYATAAELAEELRRCLDGEPVRARPVGRLRRSWRKLKQHPRKAFAAAGAVLLLAGLTAGLWYWDRYYRVKVEYFANRVARWRAMEGIGRLTPEQVRHRNGSWRLTRRGDQLERMEYVNSRDIPQPMPVSLFMDDGGKSDQGENLAIEFVRDAQGNVVQEVGKDRQGEVIWKFIFTTPTMAHFVDPRGFHLARSASGASYVQFDYTAAGYYTAMRYVGPDGKPQPGRDGTYGARLTHDERGLVTERTALGPGDGPAANQQGIARTTWRYDDQGHCLESSFWDMRGKPVYHQDGAVRFVYGYDTHGNRVLCEAYGPDGKLTIGSRGFARWRQTFDDNGDMVDISYENEDGRPVRTKDGYARWTAAYDKRGNQAEIANFDEAGRPTRDSNGIAAKKIQHDAHGHVIEVRYLDEQGRPTLSKNGNAGFTARYNDRGRRIEELSFDEHDQPTLSRQGYASWKARYDGLGREIEETYFDAAGKPTRNKAGIVRWTAEYDDGGNLIAKHYWDEAGQPTRHEVGNVSFTRRYDRHGNTIEEAYQDAHGQLVRTWLGYARIVSTYDEHGNRVDEAYYDEAGKPINSRKGYARLQSRYNERGHLVEVKYWDEKGNPVYINGCFRWVITPDERGRRIEEAAYDKDGKPTRFANANCAIRRTKFDARDNPIEQTHFDVDGKPCRHWDGYHAIRYKVNERDQIIEATYFDEAGQPTPEVKSGAYRLSVGYDSRGRRSGESYFDKAGNLHCLSSGMARATFRYDNWGNVIETAFFDDKGRPVALATSGCYRLGEKYDARRNQIEQSFLDADGRPMMHRKFGFHRWTAKYDERDNQIERNYWDTENQPVRHADGNFGLKSRYDDRGNQTEQTFCGRDGRPERTKDGYAKWTKRHDGHNNEVEMAYFDEQEQPVRGPDGWCRIRREFDDRKNHIASSYFDIDGAPLRVQVRVSRVFPNSQAARLGIKADDVLVAYEGATIAGIAEFNHRRMQEKPGDPPRELRIRRAGKEFPVQLQPGRIGIEFKDVVVRE